MKALSLVLVLVTGMYLSSVRAVPAFTSACKDVFGEHASKHFIVGVGLDSSDLFYGSLESAAPQPLLGSGYSIDMVGGSVKYRYREQWTHLHLTPAGSACLDQIYPISEDLTLLWQGSQSVKESYGVSVNLPGVKRCYIGTSGVDEVTPSHLVLMCALPSLFALPELGIGFLADRISEPDAVEDICAAVPLSLGSRETCQGRLQEFAVTRGNLE